MEPLFTETHLLYPSLTNNNHLFYDLGEGSGENDLDPFANPDQDLNPEQDPNYDPDQQRPKPLLAIEGQDSILG